MSIITINGIIYERVDTTANWNYVNPILGNKEKGFEIDSSGEPVGMKIGDGIHHWSDLPYWFEGDSVDYEHVIPAGTPIPYNIPLSMPKRPAVSFLIPKYNDSSGLILTSNGTAGITYDPIFTTSAKTTLASINVYGNNDGAGNFNEDTYVRVF